MSLSDAFRLLLKHWKLLVLVPLVVVGSLLFFTRHQKKSYASETTIYTGIASGYSLTGNAESDYFTSNNAFDNLLSLVRSRETQEQVAYWLLAHHLQLKELDRNLLNWASLVRVRELLPARLRQQLVGPSLAETHQRIVAYATANNTNEIYQLLNSHDPVYSVEALAKMTATRIGTSDLLKLEYESEDPGICRHTLELTTQVFLSQYRELRMGQTAAVIQYYEEETAKALKRLNAAEDKFLAFNRDNSIINYYEQTKSISGERELLYSDINKIEMQYAAANAALAAVDQKLAGRGQSLLSSGELLRQRRHLEELQAEIVNQQLFARQQEAGSKNNRVEELKAQSDATVQAMRTTLNDHYAQLNSVEGIPNKDLLDEWVKNMLDATSNKARLRVMEKRKGEFMDEYHKMAPLGATLKRIEREIDLAQKTYLTLLTSLNDSRASQQNNKLTTNLKIVDPPFLPLQPKGSKKLLLVAGGAFGSFFFVAACILGMGLLDKSLRKPSVAARQTGLPVLGVLPAQVPGAGQAASGSYEQRSLEYLARQLLRKASAPGMPTPFVVGIASPLRQEGKTTLVRALAQYCEERGLPTVVLLPAGTDAGPATANPVYYPAELATLQRSSLEELAPGQLTQARLVFVEFPALLEATYPVSLLPQLNLLLLALNAKRTWQEPDRKVLADIRAVTTTPIEVVLQGVEPEDSQELLGALGKEGAA